MVAHSVNTEPVVGREWLADYGTIQEMKPFHRANRIANVAGGSYKAVRTRVISNIRLFCSAANYKSKQETENKP